jgi:uncharacterized protein YjbI with pentapeptide repeats
MRRSYHESFTVLNEAVEIVGEPRPVVTRPPRADDLEFGPSIIRTLVEGADLSDLTLPGLYVGRSELRRVFLAGSDLRLSTFNWNDVSACSFYRCDLSGADLRACNFERCSFTQAELTQADMRHSTFRDCDFTGARLGGTLLLPSQRALLLLSTEQDAVIAWSDETAEPTAG